MTKQQFLQTITHLGRKPMQFQPQPAINEDDELAQAVDSPIYRDNHWDLREPVDGQALEAFWDEALKELRD